jgi:hypothetical protein
VWASQRQIADLFGIEVPAVSKHLSNIFDSGELERDATISKMEIVRLEGGRQGEAGMTNAVWVLGFLFLVGLFVIGRALEQVNEKLARLIVMLDAASKQRENGNVSLRTIAHNTDIIKDHTPRI